MGEKGFFLLFSQEKMDFQKNRRNAILKVPLLLSGHKMQYA